MDDLYIQALNQAEIGIVVIDSNFRILLWNKYIEEITAIKKSIALNQKLSEVCTTFAQERYRDMLEAVIQKQQCRFCSSKLHKAFFYKSNAYDDTIRQNMSIVPLIEDKKLYIMIQIVDITYQVSSVHKLSSLLSEMTQGYMDVKESEEINKRLAVTDPLTGLHNRIALTKSINHIIENRELIKEYALMFLDLDGFKEVNDTFGHSMGDKLLIKIAEKISINVRSEDAVARFGGDEFVILIRSKSGVEGAQTVAKKLVSEIARPIVIEGKAIRITCSIGIAMFEAGDSSEDTIKKADTAMYESKRKGKNTFTLFTGICSDKE
jgi:diguanylate cyclase (GGDEF)-like protein/PAS domain S-box-containing protein